MNNQPFDLNKMDFDTIRLKRRRRLLLRSLPFTVIALIIGIKLVSLSALTSWGIKAYSTKDYSASASRLKPLLFINRMERYKAPFNEGTALLQAGKYQEAQKQLEESLKYVPDKKECTVRINLAISLEMQADLLAGNQKYDQAIIVYDQAKAVIAQGSCARKVDKKQTDSDKPDKPQDQETGGDKSGNKPNSKDPQDAKGNQSGSKSDSQKAQDTSNRIDDKSAKAKLDRNGDKSDNPQSSSQQSQSAQEPSQDQQQKLKDMQKKAKAEQ
ncbi:MAG: tetratricopeptide repeat protein, partial [Candidatus Saccharimonadales bacterium]